MSAVGRPSQLTWCWMIRVDSKVAASASWLDTLVYNISWHWICLPISAGQTHTLSAKFLSCMLAAGRPSWAILVEDSTSAPYVRLLSAFYLFASLTLGFSWSPHAGVRVCSISTVFFLGKAANYKCAHLAYGNINLYYVMLAFLFLFTWASFLLAFASARSICFAPLVACALGFTTHVGSKPASVLHVDFAGVDAETSCQTWGGVFTVFRFAPLVDLDGGQPSLLCRLGCAVLGNTQHEA